MRRSTAVVGLTCIAVAIPGAAAAGPVAPNPKTISGGSAAVSSCGTLTGIGLSWTSTAGVVTSVALTSIPAACNNGSLSVTLIGAGNASLGSAGPLTVSGTSLSLNTTGSPTATSVTGAHVSVVGP